MVKSIRPACFGFVTRLLRSSHPTAFCEKACFQTKYLHDYDDFSKYRHNNKAPGTRKIDGLNDDMTIICAKNSVVRVHLRIR